MTEPVEPPAIVMSPKTVAALRARGGSLYVWADKAGMLHARATPPPEAISYETVFSHDCTIHIDVELAFAVRWRITWKRLPWPHFDAVLNADTTGGILDGLLGGSPL
ncbi:MAG: hypothetical protein QOG85_878 [Gaiellaceae bacterium]|jgi:hypothetical protein|nr:hypothetical protein [Gaiellaceae bacterium]